MAGIEAKTTQEIDDQITIAGSNGRAKMKAPLASLQNVVRLLSSLSIESSLLKPIIVASTVIIMALLLVFEPAAAQEPAFTLDVSATTGQKEVSLTVPPNGIVPITLVRRKPAKSEETMDLHLSEFVSETGGSVKVDLSVPDQPSLPRQPDLQNIRSTKSLIPIQLVVPILPTAGKYTGRLILRAMEGDPLIWIITITRAKAQSPAELILDRQAISLLVTKSITRRPEEDGVFTVGLREKKGEWPLDNITVSLEQVMKAPERGFDFNNIDFVYNKRPLSISPLSREVLKSTNKVLAGTEGHTLTIPAGGHANIEVRLHHLQAGEYNATLRFRAANSVESDAQKLALTIKVRTSWLWPTIILLVGILISYTGTKGLSMIRQRSTLEKRVSELNQPWLRVEPPISPVVWARATLRQVEDLSRSLWLSSPTVIESRLSQVEQLLAILDRIRQLRTKIEGFSGNPFVIRRALHALRRTVYLLGEEPPDEKTKSLIEEKLTKLSNWLDPNKLDECYGADLKEAIDLLVGSISQDEIKRMKQETSQEILRLLGELKNYQVARHIDEKIKVEEEYYSRLKILWERHGYEGFDNLVEESKGLPVQEVFKKVDGAAWASLKKANDEHRLVINVPQRSGPDPLETYESLNFSLSAGGDPHIEQTYLFKHGLEYYWTFTLERNDKFRAVINRVGARLGSLFKWTNEQSQKLTPMSVEPRVVQYAPWPSKLTPSVTITYKGEKPDEVKIGGPGGSLPIVSSRVFHWTKGFQFAEIFSVVISIILGVGTGLATLYFSSDTFGSIKDYLTLFLWGAGVDQAKNALQILQTYSTKPVS